MYGRYTCLFVCAVYSHPSLRPKKVVFTYTHTETCEPHRHSAVRPPACRSLERLKPAISVAHIIIMQCTCVYLSFQPPSVSLSPKYNKHRNILWPVYEPECCCLFKQILNQWYMWCGFCAQCLVRIYTFERKDHRGVSFIIENDIGLAIQKNQGKTEVLFLCRAIPFSFTFIPLYI